MYPIFALFLTIFAQVDPQDQTPIWLPILIIVILLLFLWWGLTRNSIPEGEADSHAAHGHDDHGHDAHGHDDHGHGHDDHGHDDHGHDAHEADDHGHDAAEAEEEESMVETAVEAVKDAGETAVESIQETAENVKEAVTDMLDGDDDAEVETAAVASGLAAAPAPAPSEPDDLKRIEGIGPKINGVLNDAGITTFAQVAATSVADLERIVKTEGGVRIAFPESWPDQAALAAKGDWEALEKLQDELQGGRRA